MVTKRYTLSIEKVTFHLSHQFLFFLLIFPLTGKNSNLLEFTNLQFPLPLLWRLSATS